MQNLFVINSALTQPRWRALLTALIVIFFDITLAMACFFGIGLIMQKYAAVQMAMLFIGGLVVAYIGWGLLKSKVSALADIKQMLWFVTLAMVVSLAGSLITPRTLNLINKICGTVIIIYDIKLFWHFAEMV